MSCSRWCATIVSLVVLALAVPLSASAADDPPASDDSAHGGPVLDDVHNIPTNAVAGNVTFLDNVRGVSGYSALNFIHFDKYRTTSCSPTAPADWPCGR